MVPVFDGARFVRRALDSIRAQDVPGRVTIYAIDDASTDGTAAVLRDYAAADGLVEVLTQERNRGVSVSRNRGVAAGSAPIVAFLDQDDAWLPGKLAAQLAVFAARPEVGYVVGRQRIVVDEGATRPAWCRPEWLLEPQAGYLPSTLAVRRSTLAEVGPFDESMRAGGDDTDWFARARRAEVPHVHLDDAVITRYVHGTNLSSDVRTNDELLKLVRRHLGESGGAG